MRYTPEAIFNLLPAIYRLRDAEHNGALGALVRVLAEEALVVEEDIGALYDNWFIETADEWVAPYIGDLLGVRSLHPVSKKIFSQRAWIANTLGHRRRKGTLAVLEQLARDVTGYPAKAVEFFQLLATTQYLNHLRPANLRTPDLRDAAALEWIDSPFDAAPHTAEVRRIASRRGRYNIPNIGLFLWRLQSYPLTGVTAHGLDSRRFTFSPLGLDAPLFNAPAPETEITGLAAPLNMPLPFSRRLLAANLPALYGPGASLSVTVDGAQVPQAEVIVCNLADDGLGGWAHTPAPGSVAVDPVSGRVALAADAGEVRVGYHYGFSGDAGGGPYPRGEAVAQTLQEPVRWSISRVIDVQAGAVSDPVDRLYGDLAEAVADWNAQPPGAEGVIVVLDSQSYDLAGLPIIQLPEGSRLLIVAGTWPDAAAPGAPGYAARTIELLRAEAVRPHLAGDIRVQGTAPLTSANPGEVAFNGLLLEGSVIVEAGSLARLRIDHCTLAPPAHGVRVAGANAGLALRLNRCISGALALPQQGATLQLVDSIIHAPPTAGEQFGAAITAPAAPADIQSCTILGSAEVYSLLASSTIFSGAVQVARRQIGCVRFSYITSTRTPRRYRCQPDLALAALAHRLGKSVDQLTAAERSAERARLAPAFTARQYGHPAYAQLSLACAAEIRTGGEDGAEMGAFNFLKAAQREANLGIALEEYLNFGLEAGVFYVT